MIIAPCTVVTGGPEPKVYEDAGVRIAGSHIAQIAGAGDLARAYPDDTWWPARDRVVMPGFVNTHAHLARHLARGLGLRTPGEWRAYDRALSVDDVTCAVTAALVEGLHHGVTTVVDFHRSGACLDLSLSEVMGAADRLGARVATCYGAAEDDTPLERRAAIDESVGFAKEISRRRQGRLRGMLGVQATTLHGIETLLAEAMEAAGGRYALHVDLALDLTPAAAWMRADLLPADAMPALWAPARRAARVRRRHSCVTSPGGATTAPTRRRCSMARPRGTWPRRTTGGCSCTARAGRRVTSARSWASWRRAPPRTWSWSITGPRPSSRTGRCCSTSRPGFCARASQG